MSAQKIAFVCVAVFAVLVAHDILQLISCTRAAIEIERDRVAVTLCLPSRAQPQACAVMVRLER